MAQQQFSSQTLKMSRLLSLIVFSTLQTTNLVVGFAVHPLHEAGTRNSAKALGVSPPSLLSTRLQMAGFGGGGDDKKKKKTKLKPKQQWDRYCNMKKEKRVRVAVRVLGDGEETPGDWLEVGRVRSKDSAFTRMAVVRQKAIIADHARRLFPLQVKPKDNIEWAFWQEEPEEIWVVVENSALDGAPSGLEKQIGFEGRPDPASGFYCLYNEGRLVDTDYTDKI
mmetsp:Transcript_15494/g.26242  ORF Transcript_15494/g.26242 Transcript_15494/m.26242 type:complete len:223 (-) Transcript_15494:57-725(-)